MTGHELMDLGALLCGLLTATGIAGISILFGLHRLEDRLRQDDDDE